MEARAVADRILAALDGRTQAWLAGQSGVHKGSINRYCKGHGVPSAVHLQRIAQALGVTQDWLMGGEAPRTSQKAVEGASEGSARRGRGRRPSANAELSARIVEALGETELTQAEVARAANVDYMTLSRWISGETSPNAVKLKRLANALGKAPSWFLGEDEIEGYLPPPRPWSEYERDGSASTMGGVTARERQLHEEVIGLRAQVKLLEEQLIRRISERCMACRGEIEKSLGARITGEVGRNVERGRDLHRGVGDGDGVDSGRG